MELKCKEDFFMQPLFCGGEEYMVQSEDKDTIVLINESDRKHRFSKDPTNEAYFGKWFDVVE